MTRRHFFGYLLYGVGLMTAILAGGCGIFWFIALIQDKMGYAGLAWQALLIGGIPTFIGYEIFKIGRKIIRSRPPQPEPTDTSDTQR